MREHNELPKSTFALVKVGLTLCAFFFGVLSAHAAGQEHWGARSTTFVGNEKPIVMTGRSKPDKDVHVNSGWKLFLVGTNRYDNMKDSDLCYAVADVTALKARFIELGVPEENITILTTGSSAALIPEKKNIEVAFKRFITNLEKGDSAFVYLSGHGFRFERDKRTYYAPQNVVVTSKSEIIKTSVAIDDMIESLRNSSANLKWMTVDACRNDPTEKLSDDSSFGALSANQLGLAKGAIVDSAGLPDSFVFMQGCEDGQYSLESPDLQQGLMAYALLEALQYDNNPADRDKSGELKLVDLLSYVQSRTEELARCCRDRFNRPCIQRPALTNDRLQNAVFLTNLRHGVATPTQRQGTDSGEIECGSKAGEVKTLTIAGVQVNFHWAPSGRFQMGSPESEQKRLENETLHEVELTQGFWIAETETTQELWQAVMGNNPSEFRNNHAPVEQISWDDCQDFLNELNSNYSSVLPYGYRYALPTEAQWEYACRAGTSTPFAFGASLDASEANFDGNYPYGAGAKGAFKERTTPVKSYAPNDWGLYDMHGNVWEWCADLYDRDFYSTSESRQDPEGGGRGSDYVLRGGSWNDGAKSCRSSYRNRDPGNPSYDCGVRLVLVR
ncbi:MAG: SUMF1/EgtB/PvdO family nonheme iron enzyme [Planctomycetia bacterium]|nr:SUMF1/EgtB/PvdO family nonheme iron enzyme [Planctomycetia bacterium]